MPEAIIVQGSGVLEEAIEVYLSGLCANSARAYQDRIRGSLHKPQIWAVSSI